MDVEAVGRKFQKELNAGVSSLVLLQLLQQARRPMYGYEIGKELEQLAGGDLPMHQGALYPALRSLEKGGLLASQVMPSVTGPPRRYYQVTDAGTQALTEWLAAWQRIRQFVDTVLETSHVKRRAATPSGNQTLSRGTGTPTQANSTRRAGRRPGRRA